MAKIKIANIVKYGLGAAVWLLVCGFVGCGGGGSTNNSPGTPDGPHSLSANPNAVDFGSLNLGANKAVTVTVTNPSSGNSVTIAQATIMGPGFSESGPNLPITLAAGQSVTFSLIFAPATPGPAVGSLTVLGNGLSTLSLPLSGVGVSVSHSVSISWDASSSTNIQGYRVYRGLDSGGPYAQISSTLGVNVLAFNDPSVASGQTYYYVVTTVDTVGAESVPSVESSGAIPLY